MDIGIDLIQFKGRIMTKNITFKALSEQDWQIFPKPYPASENIPDWWKVEKPYIVSQENPTGGKIILQNGVANASFKKCTPMLDAITSGYIVPLWADVQVRQTQEGPSVLWRTIRDVFQTHGETAKGVEPPVGYSNNVFKYLNTWIPQTPKGYSVLITAPFGHRNLPFHAIPGIIDSDGSTLDIIPPMWLKENFEGIIEKGTPMFQITPFKRESWEAKFDYFKGDEFMITQEKNFNSTIVNHYIKNVWSKKSYK